jgi:triphosphoribosyl-dephospho-CoA synthase
VTARAEQIAAAFRWACLAELEAPKPGNVHRFAGGHRMTVDEFVCSAEGAAAPLSAPAARVGARILGAVGATAAAVGANTNLGIVLLCAPLAAAADNEAAELRVSLARVLRELDVVDAELAFAAIMRAAPAGLGHSARHDVFAPAQVSLLQAMREAADRDRIAHQYASDFADVFELGLPLLASESRRRSDLQWATLATYLRYLSSFPDSHIVRKHSARIADEIRRTAATLEARLRETTCPAQLLPELLAWDATLKADGVNPGTSADLTVATLFAFRLRTILPSLRNSG